MTYLLDTCVISEVLKPRPSKAVLSWLETQDEQTLYLSVLTLGEIQKGIAKLMDGKRKTAVRRWLDEDLRRRFADRILPIDEEVALTWGLLQGAAEVNGKPVATIDGLIGATAIANNLTIATRDENDMGRTGARVFNPWRQ